MENESTNQWKINWLAPQFEQQIQIGTPEWKACKKKNIHYKKNVDPIMFKNPYKFDVRLKCSNTNVTSRLTLIHKNMESVSLNQGEYPVQVGTQATIPLGKFKPDGHLYMGPFHFNVCSYKHEGRNFRMLLILSIGNVDVCQLISSDFNIKAKKPIIKPGSKKKRTHSEMMKMGKQVPNPINSNKLPDLSIQTQSYQPFPDTQTFGSNDSYNSTQSQPFTIFQIQQYLEQLGNLSSEPETKRRKLEKDHIYQEISAPEKPTFLELQNEDYFSTSIESPKLVKEGDLFSGFNNDFSDFAFDDMNDNISNSFNDFVLQF